VKEFKKYKMKRTHEIEMSLAELKITKAINIAIMKTHEADKLITNREVCINQNRFIDSIIERLDCFLNTENELGVSDALPQHGDLHDVTRCTENVDNSEDSKASVGDTLQSIPDDGKSFSCQEQFRMGCNKCDNQCDPCLNYDKRL
jgi:hypothetical protein